MAISEAQKRWNKAATQTFEFCMKEIRKIHPTMPRVQRKILARKATAEGMKEWKDPLAEGQKDSTGEQPGE